jgi:hypothetical protein
MIAQDNGRLAAGLLVVAIDRTKLAPHYRTMPQFGDVAAVLDEMRLSFPLLLIGFDGEFERPGDALQRRAHWKPKSGRTRSGRAGAKARTAEYERRAPRR